jgi:hypothetical protein
LRFARHAAHSAAPLTSSKRGNGWTCRAVNRSVEPHPRHAASRSITALDHSLARISELAVVEHWSFDMSQSTKRQACRRRRTVGAGKGYRQLWGSNVRLLASTSGVRPVRHASAKRPASSLQPRQPMRAAPLALTLSDRLTTIAQGTSTWPLAVADGVEVDWLCVFKPLFTQRRLIDLVPVQWSLHISASSGSATAAKMGIHSSRSIDRSSPYRTRERSNNM